MKHQLPNFTEPFLSQLHALIKSGISYLTALKESGIEGLDTESGSCSSFDMSALGLNQGNQSDQPITAQDYPGREEEQAPPTTWLSTQATPHTPSTPMNSTVTNDANPSNQPGLSTGKTTTSTTSSTGSVKVWDKQEIPDNKRALEYLHSKIDNFCSNCCDDKQESGSYQFIMGEGNTDYPPILILLDKPQFEQTKNQFSSMIMNHIQAKLMTNMLKAIQINMDQVYTTAVLKCSHNYTESYNIAKIITCTNLLTEQITIIKPKIILGFGLAPATALLRKINYPIDNIRGQWFSFMGCPVMITHSLDDLLSANNKRFKADTWKDLKSAKEYLDTHP